MLQLAEAPGLAHRYGKRAAQTFELEEKGTFVPDPKGHAQSCSIAHDSLLIKLYSADNFVGASHLPCQQHYCHLVSLKLRKHA